MFNLDGKSALITGGGSGIGRAIATLFSEMGASVAVVDVNASHAAQTADIIRQRKVEAKAYTVDVTDQQEVASVVRNVMDDLGRIDILVNSAGIAHIGNLENTTSDDLDRVYEVNVKGTYHMMHAVITHMKNNGGGCILNMASIAATVSVRDRFAYSMTKGAVVAMTLSVAQDYIQNNIRVNCISPARIHTSFVDGFLKENYPGREQEMYDQLSKAQPIGRMGTPEEVANLALFLCSDQASFITGCDYPIDGGYVRLR